MPRGWLRATVVSTIAFVFVGAAAGFIAFLSQLRGAEIAPDRKADGIVVLTGGSSRVSDAMELLAAGYGRRLLISGVHPTSTASDISRTLPENQSFMTCCVDLDRTALSTRGNAAESAALGRGARLQIADRGHFELSHAARAGGILACDAGDAR